MVKIAFSGIGGVGGYYGGRLAAHYQNSDSVSIYFISRGKNREAIRQSGLRIQTKDAVAEARPAMITDRPADIGVVDYLFCTTKSYDLEENIRQLLPLIGTQTVVIPLLNGADITERLRRILPHNTVWYGCVYIGARLAAPGLVTKFTERSRLWFGDPEGDRHRQQALLHLLTAAGIDALNPEDIITRIWQKFFLISVGATLTSYYNQSIGEILQHHREGYRLLGDELMQIARAKGIVLPDDMVEKVMADQQKMPYDATTSMHTDFRNGKQTELDTLTGYVVRAGQEYGIPTPAYNKMYEKLKQRS